MSNTPGFKEYLVGNRKLIFMSAGLSAFAFIVLKFLYPSPDLFSDSNSYIIWAKYQFKIGYRPTGYSYFLYHLHDISDSSLFTVFVQYLLFALSSWFCFFSVDFLFGLPEKIKRPVLLVVLLNPMLILQTNLISSDSVFCSLTVIWLTLCLWSIVKGKWWSLALQLVALYFCFEVRFTAMFFPFVACVVFLLCPGKWVYRLTSVALTSAVIFLAAQRERDLYEQTAGVRMISGFSGWQIANNALYCYKHINIDPTDLPSTDLQKIDHEVKMYIDSVNIPEGTVGSTFMWDHRSPLKMLCFKITHYSKMDYVLAWIKLGRDYNEYGWYIVKNFPGAYTRYFLVPNTWQFFYPDKEALVNYNSDHVTTPPKETAEWFSPTLDKLECRVDGLQKVIMSVFPAISLLLNLLNMALLGSYIYAWVKHGKRVSRSTRSFILLWGLFYLVFVAFSIFAASVNLRFMDTIFVLGVFLPTAIWYRLNDELKDTTTQDAPVVAPVAAKTSSKK